MRCPDTNVPRRLGPKRATRIRKLFALDKGDNLEQYRVKREIAREGKKPTIKAPKIQRLVSSDLSQTIAFVLRLVLISGDCRSRPSVCSASARSRPTSATGDRRTSCRRLPTSSSRHCASSRPRRGAPSRPPSADPRTLPPRARNFFGGAKGQLGSCGTNKNPNVSEQKLSVACDKARKTRGA